MTKEIMFSKIETTTIFPCTKPNCLRIDTSDAMLELRKSRIAGRSIYAYKTDRTHVYAGEKK